MKVGDLIGLIREPRDRQTRNRVGVIYGFDEALADSDSPFGWPLVMWANVNGSAALRTCTNTRYLKVVNAST